MSVRLEQSVQQLTQSGLLTAEEIATFIKGMPANKRPGDGETLAKELVAAGRLTKYQAAAIYQGKGKHLVFGDYMVLDKLGHGGMGIVYKAVHRHMRRVVAAKALSARSLQKPAMVKRFHREIETIAKLSHPNIVTVHDAREHEGMLHLIMEYVEGQSLADLVTQRGPLTVADAVDYTIQVAQGLEYAHGKGIIHRDIKPGNLLLDKQRTVKILDLGLARIQETPGSDTPPQAEQLTDDGQVTGTCDYMAPEQAHDSRQTDCRSDIYSLGCTMYRLLTGHSPYERSTAIQVLLAHREAPIPSIRVLRPDVPTTVDAICTKMLAKKPEDRYASMAEVISVLEGCRAASKGAKESAGKKAVSETASTAGKSPRPGMLIAGAAAVVILGLVIAWAMRDRSEPGDPAADQASGQRELAVNSDASGDSEQEKDGPGQSQQGADAPRSPSPISNPQSPPPPFAKPSMTADEAAQCQKQWAEHMGVPVELTNSIGMKLALIPPGEFDMGSTAEDIAWAEEEARKNNEYKGHFDQLSQEAPRHRVKISKAFYSGMYLVTQGEYEKVTGSNPSAFAGKPMDESLFQPPLGDKSKGSWKKYLQQMAGKDTGRHPVEMVTWDQSVEFCRKLSALPEEQAAGRTYRLLTEAQWEYACRAGTTTRWYSGNDLASLEEYAWCFGNSKGMTHPVGEKKPNPWGLFDMHGNVSTWCWDWHGEDYYGRSPAVDPAGPAEGTRREIRGGAWIIRPTHSRSAFRSSHPCLTRYHGVGFRVCIGPEPVSDQASGQRELAVKSGASSDSQPKTNTSRAGQSQQEANAPRSPSPIPNPQSPTPSSTPPLAQPAMTAIEAVQCQKQWAEHLSAPVELVNSIGMRLVLIPPGEFDMGASTEEIAWALEEGKKNNDGSAYFGRVPTEGPRHRVKISRAGYLGMYPVTQGEYEYVMGVNPSNFAGKPMDASLFNPPLDDKEREERGKDSKAVAGLNTSRYPVEMVLWDEAMEFCRKLSGMPGEQSLSRTYRLPTEAEWEYACRAGTTTRWSYGDDEANLAEYAWYKKNSGSKPHSVGGLRPNSWGLSDMNGNTRQWCMDWQGGKYYAESPMVDPTGPKGGSRWITRGATWTSNPADCRSACRTQHAPRTHYHSIGFRLWLELTEGCPQASGKRQPAVNTEASRNAQAKMDSSVGQNQQGTDASRSPVSRAVPEKGKVAAARKAAEDLFKEELAKADTAPQKVAMSKKLTAKAAELAADPPGRFALLQMAQELALEAGHAPSTFEAIDQLASAFDVDRFGMKIEILTGMLKQARMPAARKPIVDLMLTVLQDALEEGELAPAQELLKVVTAESTRMRSKELVQQVRKAKQELDDLAEGAEVLKKAQATLAEKPADPQANVIVGGNVCFVKDDWPRGLAMLAKGGDAPLAVLAREELKTPPDPDSQVKLADGWWELSEKERGRTRENVQRHAGQWYLMAAPGVSGLVKKKVDQRLNEVRKLRLKLGSVSPAVAPFDAEEARRHQSRWAGYLGLSAVATNSIGMKFVLIPPGEFDMGSTAEEIARVMKEGWTADQAAIEGPRHRVKISRAYYLGMYEVTQKEYLQVMGVNPSNFSGNGTPGFAFQPPLDPKELPGRVSDLKKVVGKDTSRYPVEMVSWNEAMEFCRKLSELPAERAVHRTYRLPTEAQWEYACRAGTTTRWCSGDDEAELAAYAWFNTGMPHPVGEKKPNAWGLFDMHGNVWEWCGDWFSKTYYKESPAADPTGPSDGPAKMTRGGVWKYKPVSCRSASRERKNAGYRAPGIGFRVLIELEETKP